MHNFKQDSDGQKSFPHLKTDVTTKWRNHLVPIPSQRNLAIDTSSSSSAQPSLSFHYAWYEGTGFLCVGHPGHLVPPLGLFFSVSGYHSKLFREVCGKSKWKFKMAFAMKGGVGSRGGLECHIPILKNDFC